MSKKMLWYACLGLLCCSTFVVLVNASTQRTVSEIPTMHPAVAAFLELEKQIAKSGETPELMAQVEKLQAMYPGLRLNDPASIKTVQSELSAASAPVHVPTQGTGPVLNSDEARTQLSPVNPATAVQENNRSQLSNRSMTVAEKNAASLNTVRRHATSTRDPNPLDEGGETCASATVIASIPYSDGGNTSDNVDDDDEICPFGGSTSPDVMYSYTPAANISITLTLCNGPTDYDTKLYIRDSIGNIVACNDDACSSPEFANWVSMLACVDLVGGETYCIVVDGYFGDSGTYTLDITECTPCDVVCQIGDVMEVAETVPTTPAEGDTFSGNDPDGGCNNPSGVVPGVVTYQDIDCGDVICGRSFTYQSSVGDYRDTDWLRFNLAVPSDVSWTVSAEFPLVIFILDGACSFIVYASNSTGIECTEITATALCLAPGDYVAWVGPGVFTGVPESDWRGTLTCTPCVLPTGRCCYGPVDDPICEEDMYLTDCNNLGGTWIEGATCASDPCPVCDVVCEVGDVLEVAEDFPTTEAEGDTFSGADPDGGCNNPSGVVPGVVTYQDIDCGDVICGRCFTYTITGGGQYRDTDWLRFTLASDAFVTWSVAAEFPLQIFILDGSCSFIVYASNSTFGCEDEIQAVTACLTPGDYVAWVGPAVFAGVPENSEWRGTLTCSPCIGRCCYGEDPQNPLCQDGISPTDCANLGGTFALGLNCIDNPCPIPPVNDLCDDAIEVAVPSNTIGSTILATSDDAYTTILTCGTTYNTGTPGVWYWLQGTGNTVTVSTCNPNGNYDSKLHAMCRGCEEAVCIAGNDDDFNCTEPFLLSTISFCTQADCEYLILVHGFFGSAGDFELVVTDDGIPCEAPILCCATPAPCDPVADLNVYLTAPNDAAVLRWTAPQAGDYSVYSTTTPNTPNYPDAGWSFEATVNSAGGATSWTAPAGFVNYKRFTVVAECEGIVGRCCYGEEQCEMLTEDECNNLAGDWDQWSTCDTPCPGVGENCENPIIIPSGSLPTTVNGDLTGTINDYESLCGSTGGVDRAYQYTPIVTELVTLSLCGGATFDTELTVLENGIEIACIDDYCGLQSQLDCIPFVAGNVYCIYVEAYSSFTVPGPYTLNLTICEPPTCTGEFTIGALPYTNTSNTCGQVNDTDEICPYGGSLSEDESYVYTPASTETVTISVCTNGGDTFYDSKIYVYDSNFALVACNDDACTAPNYSSFASRLDNVPLTGGETYCIVMDGYGSDCGAYTISVQTP